MTKCCPVCGVFRSASTTAFCYCCQRSYDRHVATDDGTLWSALKWAADRARRFERARLKEVAPPDDDSY